jgi:hypothetical protein
MASSAFPALAINAQRESPLNMLGKIEQIKSAQQSQEMAGTQVQEARVAQKSCSGSRPRQRGIFALP